MKTVKDLKKAYLKADREGKEQFEIDGFVLVTGYAKYLLEYLKSKGVPDGKPLKSFMTQPIIDTKGFA